MSIWQLQTAKAKLSEVLRAARDEGPQTISVRGKEEFVVMTKADATRAGEPKSRETVLDILRPILGIGEIELPERRIDRDRPIPFAEDE